MESKSDSSIKLQLRELSELRPTEQHCPEHAAFLANEISRLMEWTTPIMIDVESGVIMDGHHRYSAAKLLQLKRVPCIALSYKNPLLSVSHWDPLLTISTHQILQAGLTGQLLGKKTTRHQLAKTLPKTAFKLADLACEL
ncbi:ParB N-terminal domain-containing protein [Pseudoalteromonas sp. OOF1S-7]|uniref:ParB N-terminal domain-containing protein n=1 Tax=Pseudoalteromonas sp. OOF1S-7 TaxID=2917757 RepID=UPI001EF42801|nr:ParB N-terminal domain-containing protein [Pseudoalteromonas sp. OOF1S-7]MCG7533914.1 ParB N-terminal domain-containing protein [Pseudoalteromonas sp. OOF1S-7]